MSIEPGRVARVGVGRVGACRVGACQPRVFFRLDGDDVTANVRQAGFTIHRTLTDIDTLQASIEGLDAETALMGKQIEVFIGNVQDSCLEFAGNILTPSRSLDDESFDTPIIHINAVSYAKQLDRYLVTSAWVSVSASALITDVRDGWFPTWVLDIDPAIDDTLDEFTVTNRTVRDTLDQLCERIGAYWDTRGTVDGGRILRVYRSRPLDVATTITRPATGVGIRQLRQTDDASAVITRIWSEGGGSRTLCAVPAGASTFPVEDASWYLPRPSAGSVPTSPVGFYWTNPYLSVLTSRLSYSGGVDTGLTPPTTTISDPSTPLTSVLEVEDATGFPSEGWVVVNGVYVHYTSVLTFTPGHHLLMGITPTDDYGAMTAAAEIGDVVTVVPCLIGVSGLDTDAPAGTNVNVGWVLDAAQFGDLPDGTDASFGYPWEFPITDGRRSFASARAAAVAELYRYYHPRIAVTYVTEDKTMQPGATVTLDVPGFTDTPLVIQDVTITRAVLPPDTTIYPTRTVTAGSAIDSFAVLFRRLQS